GRRAGPPPVRRRRGRTGGREGGPRVGDGGRRGVPEGRGRPVHRPPEPGRPGAAEGHAVRPGGGDRPVRGRHGRDPLRGGEEWVAPSSSWCWWSPWHWCSTTSTGSTTRPTRSPRSCPPG